MAIISLGFKSYPEAQKLQFAQNIYERMSTNTLFVSLKPFTDELKVKIDAYIVASAAAVNGGKDRTAEKNAALKSMVSQLEILAFQVNILSEGSEFIILAAGFKLRNTTRSPKEPVTELPTPEGLVVDNLTRNGVVVLIWKPTPHAIMYAIEHQISDDAPWVNGKYSTTPERTVLTGYEPGKKIKFRIRGFADTGVESDWTSPVSIWVS